MRRAIRAAELPAGVLERLGPDSPLRGMRRQPRDLEHPEQCAVIAWGDAHAQRCPALALLFAVPNGGMRGWKAAKRLKAEGVRPGVPDLFLPVPRRAYHGLFIEMKATDGRTSPEQNRWLKALHDQGYCVNVSFGHRQAIEAIMAYLDDIAWGPA